MRIVVTGITGFRNRGVEASALPTLSAIAALGPAVDVTVLTEDPDYDRLRLAGTRVEVLRDRVSVPRTLQGRMRHLAEALSPSIRRERRQALEAIRSAAMVVASGGDLFTSSYGTLERHLRPLDAALEAGVPVVFLAQTIGPFATRGERDSWLRAARRASLVTVRERLSWRYVTGELGLPPDLVHPTADPAFLLPMPPPDETLRLLKAHGLPGDGPVVAAAVSQGITTYAGHDAGRHVRAWCDAIRLLRAQLGARVLLVPHVQERLDANDDRVLAVRILDELGSPGDVTIAGAGFTAVELKALLAACDLVVAERMHAAIAALSSEVCAVLVAYSTKARGILADLLPNRDPARWPIIQAEDFLDRERASRVLHDAWRDREAIVDELRQALPDVRRRAEQNFVLIGELFQKQVHLNRARPN